ncbi:hypothetical protein FRC11_001915 [Ceratobasidium sp. 423]|nr:hypothetical protein FRC11_001915 [Ceratobasidium sp. 423]
MAEVEAMEAAKQAMGVDNVQDEEIWDAGDDTQQFGGGDIGPKTMDSTWTIPIFMNAIQMIVPTTDHPQARIWLPRLGSQGAAQPPWYTGDTPTIHILAHVTKAKGVEGDGTKKILTFTEFGRSFMLNIISTKHVAGWVFTQGVQAAGEWAIIDYSSGLTKMDFQVGGGHDDGDNERWEN